MFFLFLIIFGQSSGAQSLLYWFCFQVTFGEAWGNLMKFWVSNPPRFYKADDCLLAELALHSPNSFSLLYFGSHLAMCFYFPLLCAWESPRQCLGTHAGIKPYPLTCKACTQPFSDLQQYQTNVSSV